jgi:hypothetical protein
MMSLFDRAKANARGSFGKKTAENSMILNILALESEGRCSKKSI